MLMYQTNQVGYGPLPTLIPPRNTGIYLNELAKLVGEIFIIGTYSISTPTDANAAALSVRYRKVRKLYGETVAVSVYGIED